MKHKQKEIQHVEMINAIHAENRRRRWGLAELARHLGISHVYMSSLSNGARKLSTLGIDKQRKLAEFLGMSLVDLLVACGTLTPSDFQNGEQSSGMERI